MGDKRCPKCGGFVPAGNANCNHCGHKMFMFGGSSLYVGSSKNANKLDSKENPFSDGKKNNGCVVFIFILIVLFPVIINSLKVIFEEFKKEGLTFENILEDIFDDEDYYVEEDFGDEDNIGGNVCYNYCGDYNYETARDYCLCSNGNIYGKYGVKYDVDNSNEKEYSNDRCSIFCNESGVYLGGACYCKSGDRYDYYSAEPIGKSDEVVIQNLLNDLDNNKNVLIYGPGDGEGNYSFDEVIDPVELDDFMRNYDYEVYFLDYDGIFPAARSELFSKYRLIDFHTPYYYLFRNGVAIKNGVFFNSLDQLKQVLDDVANKETSQ